MDVKVRPRPGGRQPQGNRCRHKAAQQARQVAHRQKANENRELGNKRAIDEGQKSLVDDARQNRTEKPTTAERPFSAPFGSTAKAAPSKPEPEERTEPTLEELKADFTATLREEHGEKIPELWGQTQASQEELRRKGSNPDPVLLLAAHTRNHAKEKLKKGNPGLTFKQVRAKAETDPALAKELDLFDKAGAIVDLARAQKSTQAGGAGPQNPGASAQQAGAGSGPQNPNPPDGPNGPQQPMSQQAIAEMQQENLKTMMEIQKGWRETMEAIRKGWAEMNELTRRVSEEIADMFRDRMIRRRAKADEHHKTYVHLLTEVWPK